MIHVKFDRGGKVTITPTGYGGTLCREATRPYIEVTAGQVVSDTPTAEANEPEGAIATQQRAPQTAKG